MALNKRDQERFDRILPKGMPRYVRIYDNGGETADRYLVVFNGKYRTLGRKRGQGGQLPPISIVTMSGAPFHPQGFCQHGEWATFLDAPEGWTTPVGRKNRFGRRIAFADLNEDCRHAVVQDYIELWELPHDAAWRAYNTWKEAHPYVQPQEA
jgi:hypothetical protein